MSEELAYKVLRKTEEKIQEIVDNGIEANNLEYLDKLVDIHKDIKTKIWSQ